MIRNKLLAVGIAAGLLLTASPPASAAVTATYNVWVWNVAGWTMHRASTTDGLITALTESIVNRDTDFVALNELCHNQYAAVITRLRALGWPQDPANFARFAEGRATVCNGHAFGNAIFSRRPLGTADRFTLPHDGGPEQRTLLCAPVESQAHLRFCATHITPSNEYVNGVKINEQQLDYVLARLESYHAAGDTVLTAGDFNAQPHYGRLNNWYASSLESPNNSGNTGHYRELDDRDGRCAGYGETTVAPGNTEGPCGLGKKIDMIFVRENRLAAAYTGDSLAISNACGGPCSDHRILIGTATVRIN